MFINSLLLAISSSIDSLGIGITYGIKNMKISFLGKLILFAISFFIAFISIACSNLLKIFLPNSLLNFISSFIFISIGSFILFQTLHKKKNFKKNSKGSEENKEPKIYSFFIKFLGITIKIIKDPQSSDLDNSNIIDYKEASFLGFALSLDSFSIGIANSLIDNNFLFFPIFCSGFQFIFINVGFLLGNKINNISKLSNNVFTIISSILLILIGFIKFFIIE